MKLFQRKSKKDKTLWTEYPDYNPIHDVREKPLFDETIVTDEHRVLGQILRENWDLLHPLTQDYILSCAQQWRILHQKLEDLSNRDNNQILETMKEEFENKITGMTLEKDAEIEKLRIEIAEEYKDIIEEKEKEIQQLKMLADSVKSSFNDKKNSETNLEDQVSTKDKRIAALEKLIDDLRHQTKSQEIEAMNVQTGISKNFQQQINEMTKELYNRQDQIDKLREILKKAKDQLMLLKEKNGELILKNQQMNSEITQLEKALEEREKKLQQVIRTIENIE